ncbi:MAG: type I-E CRISPR-associated protein Cse1/CasA [Armatimonadota bacterium]
MATGEFNLLDEKWIMVLDRSGTPLEMSLIDVFRYAHEIKRIAGELPTQDVAVMRLLLAVLYSVFTRADLDGNHAPLDDETEALNRWSEMWEWGSFSMAPLQKYLEHYRERFFLFHEAAPFYQVADLDRGTDYTASKLMGDLSESGNKVRLFATRTGNAKASLSYAESARWLLYLNAYDDTSSKPSVRGQNMPSVGAGWLGKLGLVFASGNNLFETLMLNFVLDGERYKVGQPVWENGVRKEERMNIAQPDTLAELLTIQSRRIQLQRKGKSVVRYRLLGGDVFDKENAFIEPMTLWRKDKNEDKYNPRRHDPDKSFWRDFPALAVKSESRSKRPGVVDWIAFLKNNGVLTHKNVEFQTASVYYGDKDFFVDDVFSDSVVVNASLLTRIGAEWVGRIENEIGHTEEFVRALYDFAKDIEKSVGGENLSGADYARSTAYFEMDEPFRLWLAGIDPAVDDMETKILEWRNTARSIVRDIAKEILASTGESALVGRYVSIGKESNKVLINAPIAHMKFIGRIKRINNGGRN